MEQRVDDLESELRVVGTSAETAKERVDEQLEQAAFLSGTIEELQTEIAHLQEENRGLFSNLQCFPSLVFPCFLRFQFLLLPFCWVQK